MTSNGFSVDFTTNAAGTVVPYSHTDMELSACPFCGRVGLDLFEEIGIFSHVLSFQCADRPENSRWMPVFFSWDLCHYDGRWTISWPAIGMAGRVKRLGEPDWTAEQVDALKTAFESGFKFGPTF